LWRAHVTATVALPLRFSCSVGSLPQELRRLALATACCRQAALLPKMPPAHLAARDGGNLSDSSGGGGGDNGGGGRRHESAPDTVIAAAAAAAVAPPLAPLAARRRPPHPQGARLAPCPGLGAVGEGSLGLCGADVAGAGAEEGAGATTANQRWRGPRPRLGQQQQQQQQQQPPQQQQQQQQQRPHYNHHQQQGLREGRLAPVARVLSRDFAALAMF